MKRILGIFKSSKRLCPTCKEWARITITAKGDGWETWKCESCKVVREYRTTAHPN